MKQTEALNLYMRSALFYQVPHTALIPDDMLFSVFSVSLMKVATFEEWAKRTGVKIDDAGGSEFDIPLDALEKNEVAIGLMQAGLIGAVGKVEKAVS